MVEGGNVDDRKTVSLNPKSFRDTPLAELATEEALKLGIKRSGSLNAIDFQETSIGFCVDGLKGWLAAYATDYADCNTYSLLRDLSWHWASFCETNALLVGSRKQFRELRRDIAENSYYADLMSQLSAKSRVKEFVERDGYPYNVVIPLEVLGVVRATGESVGIPVSRFLQVGWGWSLSRDSRGLYDSWVTRVFKPLFDEVMAIASRRAKMLKETKYRLDYRLVEDLLEETGK